ncbi:hypothetical protein BY996DRAFT_6463264 [Phakopsora pachyrhizi]|nr:hypothetical protein BY996DRAFT_6463259 [Phakopsora pachyrhizi]KAI8445077.1 hypothetical protein BY996DRAFT_6463264 [Phakopsora pachyrhizi]
MPCNLSSIEQLARTIRELEIEDLMESESNSDREEDILLLHDLYTKCYLVPQSSIKLSKTYSVEISCPLKTFHLSLHNSTSTSLTHSYKVCNPTYSPEDLMQLSPSNFKQLTQTTHIAFGKLCDLLRGDSIFYNNLRQKQIALEIQVAVGLP